MANFFKSVLHLGEQSVTQPFRSIKQAAHGDFKGGFNDLFHSASKAGQDVAHSVGIRGWVGSHPMQSVGAAVATFFGGWAAMGAYGAGAAGGATGAAAGAGGAGAGSGIAAGTVIGQTVPATPGMIAAANGGGAAIGAGANAASAAYAATATPSMQILAGAGYGTGGSWATTLGGEAQIGNTGLSSGSGWFEKAKDAYNMYNRVNNLTQQGNGQQAQSNKAPQLQEQQLLPFQQMQTQQANNPLPFNGINLNTDQNNVPNFTKGGAFGGLQ
ncbi:hypothetical protein G6K72_000833 [Salmonella enterica subsp. enterica serovar Rubislaw]|nr:hypothetical protein [Salmonella enterica subsp. enterica serovar Rubislaw]